MRARRAASSHPHPRRRRARHPSGTRTADSPRGSATYAGDHAAGAVPGRPPAEAATSGAHRVLSDGDRRGGDPRGADLGAAAGRLDLLVVPGDRGGVLSGLPAAHLPVPAVRQRRGPDQGAADAGPPQRAGIQLRVHQLAGGDPDSAGGGDGDGGAHLRARRCGADLLRRRGHLHRGLSRGLQLRGGSQGALPVPLPQQRLGHLRAQVGPDHDAHLRPAGAAATACRGCWSTATTCWRWWR